MSASAPLSPTEANERLMKLVPEQVGAWKMASLRGASAGIDGTIHPAAEAEFHNGPRRASVTVAPPGPLRITPPATPFERNTGSEIEKVYAEKGGAIRETVRKADNRGELVYTRADGSVVTVSGTHVPAADLKALALAVKTGK